MKKLHLAGFALLALTIVLAACPMEPPNNTTKKRQQQPFSIAGTFTSGAGTSYFTAKKSSGGRSIGRAVSVTQESLAGTLDDGDMTFRLKGFRDTETGGFTLSSTSSYFKFSINGNAGGGVMASVATRTKPEDPFGEPELVTVDATISGAEAEAAMTGTKPQDPIAGLDEDDFGGVWYDAANRDIKYTVDDWGMSKARKVEGKWIDGTYFSFSEIAGSGDVFDVTADFTSIDWTPPKLPRDFPAYLESEDYQVLSMDVYQQNLPLTATVFSVFPYRMVDAPLNPGYFYISDKGNGNTYGLFVGYDPDNTQLHAGSSEEKPFVLAMTENGEQLLSNSYPYCITGFATFAQAMAKAQETIQERGGTVNLLAVIQEELGVGYSDAGIELNRDIQDYQEATPMPYPTGPDDPNIVEITKQQRIWSINFQNFVSERFNHYFPETYPDADKIVFQHSYEYNDMLTEWISPFLEPPVTKYVKWNVSLSGGKLVMKAWRRSGTPQSGLVYLDDPLYYNSDYAGISSLTTLSTQSEQDSLDNGCITTMER